MERGGNMGRGVPFVFLYVVLLLSWPGSNITLEA